MDGRHTSYDDLQRSLGRVEGSQTAMERRMDHLENLVADGFRKVEESIQSLRDDLSTSIQTAHDDISELKIREGERKGAWKAIVGVAAAVGAVVGFVVEWVANRGHL